MNILSAMPVRSGGVDPAWDSQYKNLGAWQHGAWKVPGQLPSMYNLAPTAWENNRFFAAPTVNLPAPAPYTQPPMNFMTNAPTWGYHDPARAAAPPGAIPTGGVGLPTTWMTPAQIAAFNARPPTVHGPTVTPAARFASALSSAMNARSQAEVDQARYNASNPDYRTSPMSHQTGSGGANSLQAMIDKLLADVGNIGKPGSLNVNTAVKDPGQADAIASLLGQTNTDNAANRGVLDDFINNLAGGRGADAARTQQEISALDDFFNGGFQSKLDQIAQQRTAGVKAASRGALDKILRNQSLGALGGRTQSYLDRLTQDSAADLMAKEAIDISDLNRSNYLLGMENKAKLSGTRSKLFDDFINRGLAPINLRNAVSGSAADALGRIGNLRNDNTAYNIETPEESIGRRISLIDNLRRLYT